MSQCPLVSIVLPTYNGSRYLEQSIQSCRDQTYNNWELIIVDDSSTDDTPEIIARYSSIDERIRSIRHQRNSKLPKALNSGFSQANGVYLTWTSDDNCYRPSAIAEMIDYLETHQENDIVYTDFTAIDEKGQVIKTMSVGAPADIYYSNCIGPCFLYRRAVQEKLVGYSEDLFLAEDYDFWLRASLSFSFCPIHSDLYLYRYHETSLTTQKRIKVLRATEQVYKRHFPQMHSLEKDIQAKSWINLAGGALGANNIILARKYLLYAITSSPSFVYRNNHDMMIANHQLAIKESLIAEKQQEISKLKNYRSWKTPLIKLYNLITLAKNND
ncbi:MAG: glycosyltransferase [Nitrospirae bacterium]|nr:glycosyltransferase [Nitrospirota bacterium]